MYGLEAILPIQCEISSLKLAIDLLPDTSEEEECLLNLIHLDETRREAQLANQAHKRHIKAQYDKMSNLTSTQRVTWSFFTIKKLM